MITMRDNRTPADGRALWVGIAEAKAAPQLIRAVEGGEPVVITRNGHPVAQLVPAPAARRKVRLGTMKGRIRLNPGWDQPVDLDRFLKEGV